MSGTKPDNASTKREHRKGHLDRETTVEWCYDCLSAIRTRLRWAYWLIFDSLVIHFLKRISSSFTSHWIIPWTFNCLILKHQPDELWYNLEDSIMEPRRAHLLRGHSSSALYRSMVFFSLIWQGLLLDSWRAEPRLTSQNSLKETLHEMVSNMETS